MISSSDCRASPEILDESSAGSKTTNTEREQHPASGKRQLRRIVRQLLANLAVDLVPIRKYCQVPYIAIRLSNIYLSARLRIPCAIMKCSFSVYVVRLSTSLPPSCGTPPNISSGSFGLFVEAAPSNKLCSLSSPVNYKDVRLQGYIGYSSSYTVPTNQLLKIF